jgi:hypothetical protein
MLTQFAYRNLSLFCLTLSTSLLLSCRDSGSESNLFTFVEADVAEEFVIDQKLSFTDAAHIIKRKKINGGQYAFDAFDHEIYFDPLQERQFEDIKRHFSSWSKEGNSLTYEPQKAYTLSEFLPPLIQSLLGQKFEAEEVTRKMANGTDVKASVLANCWGTMYEVLRESQSPKGVFSVFYAHDDVMKSFLFDSTYSRVIKSYTKDPDDFNDRKRRNKDLMPGDVVVVGQDYIYHVAIYLDHDLFFEKSGSGDKTIFRITTFDLLAKTWFPEVYGWSYRRFDQKILPDPMTLFSVRSVFPDEASLSSLDEEIAVNLSAIKRNAGSNTIDNFLFFLRKMYYRNEKGVLVPADAY